MSHPNRILEIRTARGLTQEELADLVSTSPQQIARLEKGQRKLTDEWMGRLAPALKVRKSELLVELGVLTPDPSRSDLIKDDRERFLIYVWRSLSAEAQDVVFTTIDDWATHRISPLRSIGES
jgi:transcriptional regulator with XRE-family HTH domain